jgi:hypothetical protein
MYTCLVFLPGVLRVGVPWCICGFCCGAQLLALLAVAEQHMGVASVLLAVLELFAPIIIAVSYVC